MCFYNYKLQLKSYSQCHVNVSSTSMPVLLHSGANVLTGSSDSEGSQSRDKNKDVQRLASTAEAGAGSSRQPAAERGLPAPPPRDLGAGDSAEMCASRQSFRLAMG